MNLKITVKEPCGCPFHHQATKKRGYCKASNFGLAFETIDCQETIPKDCLLRKGYIEVVLELPVERPPVMPPALFDSKTTLPSSVRTWSSDWRQAAAKQEKAASRQPGEGSQSCEKIRK